MEGPDKDSEIKVYQSDRMAEQEELTMKIFRILLTAALAATILTCLSGCTVKLNYDYDNADKYMPGDREIAEEIETIDIDYMAGDVTLKGSKTDKVIVTETSKTDIDDDLKVHTWVDGKTLHVKYCAAVKGMRIKDLEKTLEITVPVDVTLSNLCIDDSAGDVSVDCSTENYNIDVSAGNITINQHGESDKIDLDDSAGDVYVTAETVRKLVIDMSAGSLKLSADKAPEESEIDISAGDIELYLPEKTDLTLAVDISAGEFNSEIPFVKKGDDYILGNGQNRMEIDASAGDINIIKK